MISFDFIGFLVHICRVDVSAGDCRCDSPADNKLEFSTGRQI
jgi:hypothetical protein